jgi:hypothetical protein
LTRTLGSVRGAAGNGGPYRDRLWGVPRWCRERPLVDLREAVHTGCCGDKPAFDVCSFATSRRPRDC